MVDGLFALHYRIQPNVTVWAFFGFSQLGGLGSQVGQITITLTFLVGVGGRLKCLPQGASDVVTPLTTNTPPSIVVFLRAVQ